MFVTTEFCFQLSQTEGSAICWSGVRNPSNHLTCHWHRANWQMAL